MTMPPPPAQPQPVHRPNGRSSLSAQDQPIAGPSSIRMGGSPMTGISFTNGGGFSFDNKGGMGRSVRMSSGGGAGSYGARFYGGGFDSPSHPFSTSITMDGSSFNTSSAAFNLPPPLSTSASFRGGRSYAAAAKGERDHPLARGHYPHTNNGSANPSALSTSFASMSFQPMSFSFGAGSYSKSQVHSLMASVTSTGPNRARTDAELTMTYECCNVTHNGLHDLLEHVEDAHPFADPDSGPAACSGSGAPSMPTQHIGFSPQVMAMDMDMDVAEPPNLGTIEERVSGAGSTRSSMSPTTAPGVPNYPVPTSAASSKPSTPNEGAPSPAALSISDVLTSPFAKSLLSSPLPAPRIQTSSQPQTQPPSAASNASTSSSPPEGSLATPTTSQQPSPVFVVPKFGPTRGFLGSVTRTPQQRFDRAFNEVVAGSPKGMDAQLPGQPKTTKSTAPTAVAPGVLFASAVAGLGIPTTPPVPGQKAESAAPSVNTSPALGQGENAPSGKASTEAQLPQPSLFTTHKPWRCPNPGCNKAYKQSNGLKYHQQKGQCDFAIHDAVDLGLSIEEAEERSRPFVCAVGAGCQKRYRQMNGLKYHYLNSGEHGQYGLRMLQNGTHPMPSGSSSNANNSNSTSSSTAAASTAASSTATATTTPSTVIAAKPAPPTSAFVNPSTATTSTTPATNPVRRPIPTTSTATPTSSASAASTASRPYHIPSQIGATRPRMGVFPTNTNTHGRAPAAGGAMGGLAGIGRAGVPVRPGLHSTQAVQKTQPVQLPPIQRGRDAVLFAAVETMDL